jgi:A/G-specific adenine glycosylase
VIRDALIAWYERCARDLPWRRTSDPYAVWVSEVMLQQTRVDTVVPYYQRFLARFPTAAALAAASEDEVLAAWSGLGYYRRARLLHAGVREVVARYGGAVPEDAAARRALPGVGAYTAGAIGSIAFGREEPLVDGNVARVLARLRGIDTPLGRADTERRLWDEAARLVRGPRPGVLNQALMELGATVCTPKTPRCERCPVASECTARAACRAEALPVARAKKVPRDVALVAVVALDDAEPNAVWLVRGGVAGAAARVAALGRSFAGLHGPPLAEGRGMTAARDALARAGLDGRLVDGPCGRLVHALTHRRLSVEVWRAEGAVPAASAGGGGSEAAVGATSPLRRVPLDVALARQGAPVGISTLARKVLAAALPSPGARPIPRPQRGARLLATEDDPSAKPTAKRTGGAPRQSTMVRRPSTTTRRSR